MMHVNDRRLTGRDVLAKTFQAKTKRGYDPIEVDAYLELVASQIDILHGDIGNHGNAGARTETISLENHSVGEERDRLASELAELRAERDELAASMSHVQSANESLRAENNQLRTQLTSVAPPPPVAAAVSEAPGIAPPSDADDVDQDDRAAEESLELVLRMARRSAEETIAEAHARADEIVADANLTASQIARESDRKAYEAANRVQAELASLSTEVETQQGELAQLRALANDERVELRGLAQRILHLADTETRRYEGADVVDLRTAPSETTA